jgi:hypothetical protein
MDIKAIGVVGLADSRMTYLAERQKAVAQTPRRPSPAATRIAARP